MFLLTEFVLQRLTDRQTKRRTVPKKAHFYKKMKNEKVKVKPTIAHVSLRNIKIRYIPRSRDFACGSCMKTASLSIF